MKQRQEKNFIVDILFVLALFGLFAVSALMLVTIGANVYQSTVEDMDQNYDARVVSTYLAEKLRQCDMLLEDQSSVAISEFEGSPALVLSQEMGGELYDTYLYYHDGYLKELLLKHGSDMGGDSRGAGQEIIALRDFSLAWAADDLLRIDLVTDAGQSREIYLSTHCN